MNVFWGGNIYCGYCIDGNFFVFLQIEFLFTIVYCQYSMDNRLINCLKYRLNKYEII
jgi:hypothetical protein